MRIVFFLFLLTLISGCRSDVQVVSDVARAFVESHETMGASFRAYTFLTRADQAVVPAEEFETVFPANPIFKGGEVTIGPPVIEGGMARVAVNLSNPTADAIVEHSYVLRQEEGSWRVYLGLMERNRIRGELQRARALAKEGNIDDARDIHSDLTQAPFDFSRPETLQEMADSLDVWLEEAERIQGLNRQLSQARAQTGKQLRDALKKVESQLRPEDVEQFKQLAELKAAWRAEYQKTVFDSLPEPVSRLRRVNRDGTLKRELMVTVTNSTPHELVAASLDVAFLNDEEEVGTRAFDVPRMKVGEELALVFALDPAPDGWKGRTIHVKWRSIDLPEEL